MTATGSGAPLDRGTVARQNRPDWHGRNPAGAAMAPEAGIEFDVERPNAARMYDFFLGGAHNFEADRALARQVLDAHPDAARTLQANRAFLGRAVQWCARRGIDQFLDLGSGVRTVGNVHEVARRTRPGSRVAYVDLEPVAAAHAEEIIGQEGVGHSVTITQADLRDPDAVHSAPGVVDLLDFTRPVALLMVAVLHFVPDHDDPAGIVTRYREAMPEGSVLVLSHTSDDHDDPRLAGRMRAGAEHYRASTTPGTLRSRSEIRALLAGTDLVPPGLVDVINWPADSGTGSGHYGAVGHLTP